jgi:hypothetical protein
LRHSLVDIGGGCVSGEQLGGQIKYASNTNIVS